MARLVVLSFDDNEDAEDFIKDVQFQDGTVFTYPEGSNDAESYSTEVVGLFAKPTVFCDPGDGHKGKKTQAGWTRGKKYGWWVCGACKKPSVLWGKKFECVIGNGRNLLPDFLSDLKKEDTDVEQSDQQVQVQT